MKLFPPLKEISITEIEGLRIGNAQDLNAMTGVTVLRFDKGAKAGCDISGGGPASRETPLTSPVTADNPINAIVILSGNCNIALLACAQLYQPFNMSVINPHFGRVSGLKGGVEIIKHTPPKIDNGIATTIPSRIAAKCL